MWLWRHPRLYEARKTSFNFPKTKKVKHFLCLCSVKDFYGFVDALESVKDKSVIVAVASADNIDAANKERSGLLEVRKVQ